MVFNFVNPFIFLLLPVVTGITLFIYRRLGRLAPWRRRTALGLRLAALFLLVLSMSGFGIKKQTNDVTTIFVADQSDSTARERKAIDSALKDALNNKKPGDRIGMVVFGSSSLVEMLPTDKPDFSAIQSKPDSSFTNIEQALKLASSLIPAKDKKRIVLFSDGRENAGDALKQAGILNHQGVVLDVYPISDNIQGEVQIKNIAIPETLRMNEKFEVVVKVESTVKTSGTLKLYADRQLAAERKVEIQKGGNSYVFVDTAKKEGMVTYSAVIDPGIDQSYKNNSLSAFSNVGGKARVLVIQEEEDGGADELVRILQGDVDISVKAPDNLPETIADLQKYNAFIISDVSAERLNDRFLTSLEACIRYQGKGLLVTGGENSYAPGGYYKTVLEKVLPVNMDIKPDKEAPNLGLILVIDKSGSMSMGQYGVSKVELAKEAAIRSTEVLRPNDRIGVIGFDDAVSWVVKTQKPNNLKKIQDAIGTIRADGGTQILPPLEEAYNSLKNTDTKLKHIILLTDGQAEKSGYEPLIDKIAAAGITLSTVAVGQEADAQLLQALSIGGNGRFYMTDEFSDIPKIFAKETFLAGKAYLNTRTFTPNLLNYSDILKGIDTIPVLDGYVGTTAKSTAKVVFSSDRNDPVLATWQYGLGRTAAWTPDAKGMWTSKWLGWEQSPLFWRNLVSWVLQKNTAGDYRISTGFEAGKGKLELNLPPEDRPSNEKVEALLISPSGKEQKVSLTPHSPGVYNGSFKGEEQGVYLANINITDGSKTIKTIISGVTVPYSPEYDIPEGNIADFLQRLAKEGGGRVLDKAADALKGPLPSIAAVTDITQPLLIMVILLFFLDIAVRRVNIPADRLVSAARAVAGAGTRAVGRLSDAARSVAAGPVLKKADSIHEKEDSNKRKNPPGSGKSRKVSELDSEHRNAHISSLLEKKRKRER